MPMRAPRQGVAGCCRGAADGVDVALAFPLARSGDGVEFSGPTMQGFFGKTISIPCGGSGERNQRRPRAARTRWGEARREKIYCRRAGSASKVCRISAVIAQVIHEDTACALCLAHIRGELVRQCLRHVLRDCMCEVLDLIPGMP